MLEAEVVGYAPSCLRTTREQEMPALPDLTVEDVVKTILVAQRTLVTGED